MPKLLRCALAIAFGCGLAAAPAAGRAQEEGEASNVAPRCVRVTTQAPYRGLGYVHIVDVYNGCEQAVRCEVATSVDPEPRRAVTVAPGERELVAIRRGSPSSSFRALYECREL